MQWENCLWALGRMIDPILATLQTFQIYYQYQSLKGHFAFE